jgi:hypothetical protein
MGLPNNRKKKSQKMRKNKIQFFAIICGLIHFLISIKAKVEHRENLYFLKFLELQRMHIQYPFNLWNSKGCIYNTQSILRTPMEAYKTPI